MKGNVPQQYFDFWVPDLLNKWEDSVCMYMCVCVCVCVCVCDAVGIWNSCFQLIVQQNSTTLSDLKYQQHLFRSQIISLGRA
jgi:hypothetical protein